MTDSSLSFFGSILHFWRRRRAASSKSGLATNIACYDDEIRLLLDTASPTILKDGLLLNAIHRDKPNKILIRSLKELEKDVAYATEKGTCVYRVSDTEVAVGGGKITLPIDVDSDHPTTKTMSQYFMKGLLSPEALRIAVENFTKQKVCQGMVFYEDDCSLGHCYFDFKDIVVGKLLITPEDHIMLKRDRPGGLIHFTFGRNLYWYHYKGKAKDLLPKTAQVQQTIQLHEKLKTNTKTTNASIKRAGALTDSTNLTSSKPQIAAETPSCSNNEQSENIPPSNLAPIPPPPPPPPPPGLHNPLKRKHDGDSLVPPPPPPPLTFSPIGDGRKRRKLRQLNWSTIPRNQIDSTIWREVSSPTKLSGISIDESEIEEIFSLSPVKDNKPSTRSTGVQRKASTSILGLKRSNNAGILLSQFKMSFREIRNALLAMDDHLFTPEQLVSLKYLFPLTDAERRDIAAFKGDPNTLSPTDRFYYETLDVPEPELRIHLMIFKQQFCDHVEDLTATAALLQRACEQLQNSKKFAQILQIILKLGCVLNRSNSTAASQGFRLDTLSKLGDTKAKDGKTTVLDYLARLIRTQFPQLLDFDTELLDIPNAAKISLDPVIEELKEMKKTMAHLDKELQQREKQINVDYSNNKENICNEVQDKNLVLPLHEDRFVQVMKPFYAEAYTTFASVELKVNQAINMFNKLVAYFGDDPKTTSPDAFFSLVANFCTNFKKANTANPTQPTRSQSLPII